MDLEDIKYAADHLPAPTRPLMSLNPPLILIIGAGSRGNAYARAIHDSCSGSVVSVAEPSEFKRKQFGKKYIWGESKSVDGQEFEGWREFIKWEQERRIRAAKGEQVPEGIDAVFICVLDEMHMEVVVGLAPLDLHIMCEKPLATSLEDCLLIYKSLLPNLPDSTPSNIFSIGHVLRYSPHNKLLRKLLLEDKAIGEIMSINHSEPIGWWHFTHSYVRGNWRKESTTAPSLLTKSCHDIDLLLWILCSPCHNSNIIHLPSYISSTGALKHFKRLHKPRAAGNATNCLSCPIEISCKYSAKKIYLGAELQGLASGNRSWPVNVVVPDIEECISRNGSVAGEAALIDKLSQDYLESTPSEEIENQNWFGRCVFECDNDVCDDQVVTMAWDDSLLPYTNDQGQPTFAISGAKTAIFHMIAHTKKICQRYTNIYGSDGEIYADSKTITVEDFKTGKKRTYNPQLSGGGHGGGDDGLARQFVLAIDQVKNHGVSVSAAQEKYIGCNLEEIIRSHAIVFAAEEARRNMTVLNFPEWWNKNIVSKLDEATPRA